MIVINQAKAIEVVKGKIRAWREGEFKKNDIAIQNALVDGSDVSETLAHVSSLHAHQASTRVER